MTISIITPCLNAAATLPECLASVRQQAAADIEHIVVDGGSTDGSAAILADRTNLRLVSGADRSMYQAINRGLAVATGEIIGLLNADDLLPPGALAAVRRGFAAAPQAECLTGSAELRDLDGTLLRGFDAGRHRLTVALALYGPVVINARFFRRRLFDRLGGFCPQFRIAGDRDFLLRCAVAGVPAAETDALVYVYRRHAGSMTFAADGMLNAARDNLAISGFRLRDPAATGPARAAFRRLHGWSVLHHTWYAVRAGQPGAAVRAALRALGDDPAWPLFGLAGLYAQAGSRFDKAR